MTVAASAGDTTHAIMVPCMLSLSASLGVRVAIGRALAALGSPRACRASLSARPSLRKRREAVHLPLHRLLASLGEVGGLFTAGGVKRGALFTRGGAASAGFAVAVATGGGSSVSCSSERATVLGSPPKRASRGQAAVLPCRAAPQMGVEYFAACVGGERGARREGCRGARAARRCLREGAAAERVQSLRRRLVHTALRAEGEDSAPLDVRLGVARACAASDLLYPRAMCVRGRTSALCAASASYYWLTSANLAQSRLVCAPPSAPSPPPGEPCRPRSRTRRPCQTQRPWPGSRP